MKFLELDAEVHQQNGMQMALESRNGKSEMMGHGRICAKNARVVIFLSNMILGVIHQAERNN